MNEIKAKLLVLAGFVNPCLETHDETTKQENRINILNFDDDIIKITGKKEPPRHKLRGGSFQKSWIEIMDSEAYLK